MKRIPALFALTALIFSFPVLAGDAVEKKPTPQEIRQSWHQCAKAEDCTAVQGPCGGWVAVSKAHEGPAAEYYSEQAMVIECIRHEDAPKPVTFSCDEGLCKAGQ